MQGVTATGDISQMCLSISIHTPYAGSDSPTAHLRLNLTIFQSTLPMQGVTYNFCRKHLTIRISIHTPYAGSDILPLSRVVTAEFQSTLPMQGVTTTLRLMLRARGISIHTPYAGSDGMAGNGGRTRLDFNPHSLCRE